MATSYKSLRDLVQTAGKTPSPGMTVVCLQWLAHLGGQSLAQSLAQSMVSIDEWPSTHWHAYTGGYKGRMWNGGACTESGFSSSWSSPHWLGSLGYVTLPL